MNDVYFTLIVLGVGFAGGYFVRNHVQSLLDSVLAKIGLEPKPAVAAVPVVKALSPVTGSGVQSAANTTTGLSATEVAAIGTAVANALKVQLAPRPPATPVTPPPAAAA